MKISQNNSFLNHFSLTLYELQLYIVQILHNTFWGRAGFVSNSRMRLARMIFSTPLLKMILADHLLASLLAENWVTFLT